jgi:peptidoglycan/LPS O-acetylase OafA/YrhL
MWLSITLILFIKVATHQPMPSLWVLFLNYTTLFGFVKPTGYLVTGAWSIGNEMVFYTTLPLIVFIYHRNKWLGNAFVIATWAAGVFFAFVLLHPWQTLGSQWGIYVNPLNQYFLFTSGIFLYYNFRERGVLPHYLICGIFATVLLFCVLPTSGDGIGIVSGLYRSCFSLLCISMVFFFWKLSVPIPRFVETILNLIGAATYSVYLLHPFVITLIAIFFKIVGLSERHLLIFVSMVATLLISLCVYNLFEVLFVKLGKSLTTRW